MSKFLITGITGFAGPHLANLLHSEGHEIHGLIRNSNGREQDIRDVVNDEDYLLGIEIQKGLNSNSKNSVLFGRNERGNQFFHKYVDYYIDDNIKKPPKL